jgi:hypothetical protein
MYITAKHIGENVQQFVSKENVDGEVKFIWCCGPIPVLQVQDGFSGFRLLPGTAQVFPGKVTVGVLKRTNCII